MGTILKDKKKFQPWKGNANLENLKKFQGFLSRLKKSVLDDSVYNQIRPTAAVTPTVYGLPKVHKDNVPLRSILISIGILTYQCASWLSKSLKELRRHPSTEKDTFHFIKIIADHELGCNHITCSFDVKNLFTNIPIDFTVNLIVDKVFADKKSKFHGLNRMELRKMLNWTCTNIVLQFNEKYYTQVDGVAMGSPIAPLMADVFMNWLIDNANKIGCSPQIICRHVDDIFCTFDSKEKIDQFFYNLNKFHSNVNFSKEVEADGQMAYLDVLLTKTETGIESTTYRKNTHNGLYNKWERLSPIQYKKNIIQSSLHRSYEICSSYQLIHKEFQNTKSCFLTNRYPDWFIEKQIKIFLNKRYKNTPKNKQEKTTDIRKILLYLPYLGETSLQLEKELRNVFRKYLKELAHLSLIHKTHTIGDHFKYKDNQAHLERSNVVYKLKCSCGHSYIGQTQRNLKFRLDEHNPLKSNHQATDVVKHLYTYPDHFMDFKNPKILASAFNYRELLIEETLLIQTQQPEINVDNFSTPLYLFNA